MKRVSYNRCYSKSCAVSRSTFAGPNYSSSIEGKSMNKQTVVLTTCALLFALSFSAEAQQPGKVPRIGYVSGSGDPINPGPEIGAFCRPRISVILRARTFWLSIATLRES